MRIFRPQIGSFQGRPFPIPRPRGKKKKVETTQNNKNNNKSFCLPTQSTSSSHCNVVGLQSMKKLFLNFILFALQE